MTVNNLLRWMLGAAAALGLLGVCGQSIAQQAGAADTGIEVVPVRGGVYMLVGGGVNATVQIGDEGVLLVDTMGAPMAEKLLAAVRKLSSKPIRYILNTNANADQVGGNPVIAKAGSTIAGGNVTGAITDSTSGAAIVANEGVLTQMSSADPPPPFDGWPTSTFITPIKDVFFNGEAVQLIHQPHATSNGDSFVFFRRSDVVSTGQIFDLTRYPYIDVKNGGTFLGTLEALNRLIDLTVPADKQEGGTMVIPVRGRLCDESEVVEYRDMLTIIRDYIQEMIKEGRSLQQVLKAKPTEGYDTRYGADSGPWTTDMFVETVYRELKSGKSKSR